MAKFMVGMREVHVQWIQVEADDAEDAIERARDGEGEESFLEYSHTLDRGTWTVEVTQH